jgi:RNA polymerase subunit RPABC4/transcription elongation factor Spt4
MITLRNLHCSFEKRYAYVIESLFTEMALSLSHYIHRSLRIWYSFLNIETFYSQWIPSDVEINQSVQKFACIALLQRRKKLKRKNIISLLSILQTRRPTTTVNTLHWYGTIKKFLLAYKKKFGKYAWTTFWEEEIVLLFSTQAFHVYLSTGLPDFSWYNIPKREKYTKWPYMKCTNCHKIIPTGHKIVPNCHKIVPNCHKIIPNCHKIVPNCHSHTKWP